jgi:DNA-binding HxlR family transcriptional regulator
MTKLSLSISLDKTAIARAAKLLGDTWALLILTELMEDGCKRFGALQNALPQISPQTLSNRLKQLEAAGFISRSAYAEIPPRVEYRLTERGQGLRAVLQSVSEFGQTFMADETCGENCSADE